MKQYKISNFARLMGVTVDLVKHYQTMGILKPHVDPNNRYRYYDIRHGERLIVSKKFRNLDFSVEETHALTSRLNGEEIHDKLSNKKQELFERYQFVKQQYESIQHMEYICNLFLTQSNQVFECERPGYYYCKHTLHTEFNEELDEEVIKQLMQVLPTSVKFKQVPFQEMLFGETMIVNHGLALPEQHIDLVDPSLQQNLVHIPAKPAILYVYSREYTREKQALFQQIYRTLVEQGYDIAPNDIYVENGIDFYQDGIRYENYLIYFEKNNT